MRSAGIARPVGERTPGTGGAGLSGPAVRRGGGAFGAEPGTRLSRRVRGLTAAAGAAAVQRAGGRQPPRIVGRSHGGGYAGGRWSLPLAGDAAEPSGGRTARASSGARRQATATGHAALAANTSAPAGADLDGAGLPVARGGARRPSRPPPPPLPHGAGQGCARGALPPRPRRGRFRTRRLLRPRAPPHRR